jgi:dienelactone hydrolase
MGNSDSTPEQPSCCPPDSLPSRSAAQAGANTPTVGEEITLGENVRCYISKPPSGTKTKASIVLFHDIFGYNTSRTNHIADELASWGYLVIAPDFFGPELDGFKENEDIFSIWAPWRPFTGAGSTFVKRARKPWVETEKILVEYTLPWLENNGGKGLKIGLLGFCWGGWAITRASAMPMFSCAVGAHPAPHVQYFQSEGPKTSEIYEMIKCPMLFLMAQNDPSWYFPDGSVWKEIEKSSPKSKCYVYPEMVHGWINRGDIRMGNVKRDFEDSMAKMKEFYSEYLG